jgi:hypothetical protein
MNVLIGVAIALFVVVTLGVILWNRPQVQEETAELSPEREGTSYEEPQDEGAAELDGGEPVQGDGGEAQPDRPGEPGRRIDDGEEGRPG